MKQQQSSETQRGYQPEQRRPVAYYMDSGNPFAEPIELPAWEGEAQQHSILNGLTEANLDAHGAELVAAIRRSAAGNDAPILGTADVSQPHLPIDEYGIAHVAMNKSGYVLLGPDRNGHVATSGLAGCTGVAGFASHSNGNTSQFISHYGPYAQSVALFGQGSPINEHMRSFDAQNTNLSSTTEYEQVRYVVAYHAIAYDDPDYGLRQGDRKNWHYLDQIHATAETLHPQSRTLFLPYRGDTCSLAAGRDASGEGIYWNGMPIHFDDTASIAAIRGAVLVNGTGY